MTWNNIVEFVPILLDGAVLTIAITLGSLVISTPLAILWLLLKRSRVKAVSTLASAIINVVRGLPMIVLLFYVYFVFPDIGIQLSSIESAIAGLAFAYSTYLAEVFRSGLESVDPGQLEAAKSLGMTRTKAMIRVVFPQAFRVALPPYSSTIVMMLKDSAIASTIAVSEITREGQLIAASTFQNMTVYTLVALFYLAMSLPMMHLTSVLERRFGRHDKN
ncbi:amino acid ABC transporter permease [Paraburkholderia ferrariae]|uniref:amino acid ABC transporter permease n=1 Tax=Paraburkholderia ferrariae TaxID=386056 RepID=UPI0004877DEA|nr:amino acid ABC transporter permease [Paraburkholderia ferrariae]